MQLTLAAGNCFQGNGMVPPFVVNYSLQDLAYGILALDFDFMADRGGDIVLHVEHWYAQWCQSKVIFISGCG